MSDEIALKWRGKMRKLPDGSRIPEASIPGVPAADLTEDDVKRLAKQRGVTPATLTKELTGTGYYGEGGKAGKAAKDDAEDEGEDVKDTADNGEE